MYRIDGGVGTPAISPISRTAPTSDRVRGATRLVVLKHRCRDIARLQYQFAAMPSSPSASAAICHSCCDNTRIISAMIDQLRVGAQDRAGSSAIALTNRTGCPIFNPKIAADVVGYRRRSPRLGRATKPLRSTGVLPAGSPTANFARPWF